MPPTPQPALPEQQSSQHLNKGSPALRPVGVTGQIAINSYPSPSPRPCPHRQERDIVHEIRLTLGRGQAFLVLGRERHIQRVEGGLPGCRNSTCHFAAHSQPARVTGLGVGNRCWPGWQQPNPPSQADSGAWRSRQGPRRAGCRVEERGLASSGGCGGSHAPSVKPAALLCDVCWRVWGSQGKKP